MCQDFFEVSIDQLFLTAVQCFKAFFCYKAWWIYWLIDDDQSNLQQVCIENSIVEPNLNVRLDPVRRALQIQLHTVLFKFTHEHKRKLKVQFT